MTNSNTYIKTGNFLLDDYIEKGIPQGKLTMIVGRN
jgi:archaellum biogenesis ATPase FlaH